MTDRRILRWVSVLLLGSALPALWTTSSRPARPALADIAGAIEREEDHLTPSELDSVLASSANVRIYDLRDSAAYAEGHLPGAVRSTLRELVGLEPIPGLTMVLYSEGGVHAGQAWTLLRANGHERVFTLLGGWKGWMERHAKVMTPRPRPERPVVPDNSLRERERLLGEC